MNKFLENMKAASQIQNFLSLTGWRRLIHHCMRAGLVHFCCLLLDLVVRMAFDHRTWRISYRNVWVLGKSLWQSC